jgi:hypothetical protein
MNLDKYEFKEAVERGLNLLAKLKRDYPELRLHPVFCRFGPGSGQCGLTTDPMVILEEFPEMMIVPHEVQRLGKLLRQHRKAKKLELPSVPEIEKELNEAMIRCRAPYIDAFYCGDVNIEFRTGVLKYEPLSRLQQDPRLPPGLNTVGNIRVIAGSLEYLAQQAEKS